MELPISPMNLIPILIFCTVLFFATVLNIRASRGKNSPWIANFLLLFSMSYIVLLLAILYHPADWIRNILSRFDPVIKTAHVESQFDTACDQRMQNGMKDGVLIFLWNQVEGYVLSHSLGWWWCSIFLIRDAGMCFLLSIIQEASELWWERFYAPFRECWWDHLFLDMGCNILGCMAGAITLHLLKIRTPIMTWKMLKKKNIRILIIVFVLEEIFRFPMVFFVPHVLGIPPKHIFNLVRFFSFNAVSCGLAATQLYHILIKKTKADRWHIVWFRIWIITVLLETLIVFKFYEGKFFSGVYERASWQQYNPFHRTDPWMSFHWNLVLHLLALLGCSEFLTRVMTKVCYEWKPFLFIWIPITKKEGLEYHDKKE